MLSRIPAFVLCTLFITISISCVVFAQQEENDTRADTLAQLKTALGEFNTAFDNYVTKLTSQQESTYDLVKTLSNDYATPLYYSTDSISDEDTKAFLDKSSGVYYKYVDTLLAGYELVESWDAVKDALAVTGTRAAAGMNETRFIFVAAFVIGIGMMGYSGYKSVKNAVDKNADMSKTIIDDANTEDMKKINTELGLPEGATKDEAKAHIDGLGINDRNSAAKKVQQLDMDAELSGSHGSEIKQNQANIAVDLGKDGCKMYANAVTTVTGGQGVTQMGQAVGLSEAAATGVDIVLTVAEKEPLDLLASSVEAGMASKDTKTVTVDKPTTTKTPAEAKAVLETVASGGQVPAQDLKDAGDSLGQDIAQKHTTELGTYDSYYDGTTSVTVPDKIHVQNAGEVKNGETITVPDFGPSDLVLTGPEKVPDVVQDVDPADDLEVPVDFSDIDDLAISHDPIDIVFCIDVTGSMSDDIGEVVASASGILASLNLRNDNFRIGFVVYRDIEVDTVPFARYPFSDDPVVIQSNIDSLPGMISGGGDIPESVYEGLEIANGMSWRSEAEHSVILMGDAPPKTASSGDSSGDTYARGGTRSNYEELTQAEIDALKAQALTLEKTIANCNAKKVHIYPIVVANYGSFDTATVEAFNALANGTGGKSFTASSAASVPGVIMDALGTAIDNAATDDDDDVEPPSTGCCSSAIVLIPALAIASICIVIPTARAIRKRRN